MRGFCSAMTSDEPTSNWDVVLEVDGVQFHCLREELTKHSLYFKAMFSNNFAEQYKEIIPIQGIDADAMRFLLRWIADTSQLDSLLGDEVLVVLQAAAMLQFERLQSSCEEAMVQRWLSPESCLLTAATADQLSLPRLHQKALALSLWRFLEVRHSQAFLDLPIEPLIQYLNHESLCLGPNEDEFQVFEAVSSWLEHKPSERRLDTLKALSCVRMNFISVSDLLNMMHYSCVVNFKEAGLLLRYLIAIKEGRHIETAKVEEKYSESLEEVTKAGCCDPLKMIADHIKCCDSESDVELQGKKDDDTNVKESTPSLEKFSNHIMSVGKTILKKSKRQLPIVACIIGHMQRSDKDLEKGTASSSGLIKKNKRDKTKNGTPHLLYYSPKIGKPVPLLPLSKIDQGPSEALGYTVVSRGQDLYVIGGEYLLGYGDWNKSVWKYNVWSETWAFETSLGVPRRHHSVVCLDDDMYVVGGCGRFRVIMDSVDRYNFVSRTWHKCASLPSCLYSAATCIHSNLIYVISCQGVFCYCPTTNCWVNLNDVKIPPGSSFNTAMSFGENIYLTGQYSVELMRFNPLGEKSITMVGSFKNTAGNACLVDGKIYSFTEEDERPCVEMYDILSNTFSTLWVGTSSEPKLSFKKLGGCFSQVLYETLWKT